MAISQEQKVDFLLKKIGFTASKTGNATDATGLTGTLTPKAGFAEAIPSPLIIANTALWNESASIPATPPGSDTTQVKVYAPAGALRMTVDSTVANNRAFIAYTTYNDTSSARLTNWIDTQFGPDYIIQVFYDDATDSNKKLNAGGSGNNDGWFFDYSAGVLNFNDTNVPTPVTSTNVYIVGYRYVGQTGAPTSGISTFSYLDLTVERNLDVGIQGGISTFRNNIDLNADLDVDGHTNLDNVSVAGITTFANDVAIGRSMYHVNDIDTSIGFPVNGTVRISGDNEKVADFRGQYGGGGQVTFFKQVLATGGTVNISPTIASNTLPVITIRNASANHTVANFQNTNNASSIIQWNNYNNTATAGNLIFRSYNSPNTEYARFTGAGNFNLLRDLDVDGHTNLDNVSIAGVTTMSGDLRIESALPSIYLTDTNSNPDYLLYNSNGNFEIRDPSSGTYFQVLSSGTVRSFGNFIAAKDLDVDGHTNLDNVSIAGVATVTGNLNVGGVLTYEDVTNVDSVGIVTARKGVRVTADGSASADYISVGAGNDFKIYHTGNHAHLDSDTGHITATANQINLNNADNTQNCAQFIDGSFVKLFYAGNLKLSTEASGVNITGVCTATTFVGALSGNATSSDTIDITSDGSANTTMYPTFVNGNGSGKTLRLDSGLSYVPATNILTAGTFSGSGASLTNLNGSNISSGTVPVARIGTGTKDSTTFYRGDGTFQVVNTDLVSDTSPQLGGNLDCNNFVVTLNDSTGTGNNRLKIGNAGDLQLFHTSNANYVSGEVDGKDLYVRSRRDLHLVCGNNASGYRNVIYADNNGTTRMYHPASGAVRLNTTTTGISVSGNVVATGNMSINDNNYLYLGNSGDFSLRFHNGTGAKIESGGNNMYIRSNLIELGDNSGNKYIKCIDAGAVELYHGVNAKKLETTSVGTKVTGVIETVSTPNADPYAGFIARSSGANNHCGFFADAAGGANAQAHIRFGYSGNVTWQWRVPFHAEGTSAGIWLYDYSINDDVIKISQGGNQSIRGHMYPRSNNTYDLGSSSLRWRNIYTNDLNLSNEGGANEVDGTWGNYTIQEGESDLFLINKRNGKKYKFNLTEVS